MKLVEDEQKFLKDLNARARQYANRVTAGELVEEFASFEMLAAIYSAFVGGIHPDKLTESYPVKSWREDQVSIPRELLWPLVEGWVAYKRGQPGLALGEAMNLEGGGQGKSPIIKTEGTQDEARKLSNRVVIQLLRAELNNAPISQDAAIQAVVETQGVAYETVRKAFRKYGPDTIKTARQVYLDLG